MNTRRASVRLATLAVGAVVGGAALTGCGASGSAPAGSDASPVAATSQDVDPADFAATLSDGVASITTAQVEVSAEGGLFSGSASGPLDLTGDSPAVSLTTDGSGMGAVLGGPAELRVVDGRGYVKAPAFTGQTFADLDDVARQVGPFLKSMGGLPGIGGADGDSAHADVPDLGELRQMFKDVDLAEAVGMGVEQASAVELVGTDTVDGVDVDHYVLTFDHAGETQDVDTYLDDDGVPVRTEAETPMGTVRMDLTDLGEPVDITAPAPSEVAPFDLDEALKGLSFAG